MILINHESETENFWHLYRLYYGRSGKFAFVLFVNKDYLLTFCQIKLTIIFFCAQCVILQSSEEREPMFTARIIMYVSSAYLQSSLQSVTAWRSDAFTTQDAGPTAE